MDYIKQNNSNVFWGTYTSDDKVAWPSYAAYKKHLKYKGSG